MDINKGGKQLDKQDIIFFSLLLFISANSLIFDLWIRLLLLPIALIYIMYRNIYIKHGVTIFIIIVFSIIISLIYINYLS